MRTIFLLFLFFIHTICYAQSNNRKAQKQYEEAVKLYRINEYENAILKVNQALEKDNTFLNAYLLLGDIYKKIKKNDEAIKNYQLALSKSPDSNINLYFILGEMEILGGYYENAKQHLSYFIEKSDTLHKKYINLSKKYIDDCDFAIKNLKSPLKFNPINMGNAINSAMKEYFPALTADGQTIIFTRNTHQNEDFYYSTLIDNIWTQAQPLSKNINTTNYNEGAQSLSADGKFLLFTGCNRPDGYGKCDIYVSVRQGKNWSKPLNIGPKINSKEWESQPSISADGQTLYFLSNRAGGYGGYDIWKSTLNKDLQWSEPENLGPNINTAYDEATPFIHADGKTLYFSSEGWTGMGGKDLFYSKLLSDGTFDTPVNLGYPINTNKDEFGLIVSADGEKGYFSSDIKGGFGDLDIYQFDMPKINKPNLITYVKGLISDKETNENVDANVQIINLSNNKTVYNEFTGKENGDFIAVMPTGEKYAFNVSAEGYILYSHHFDIKNEDANKPIQYNIQLEKIKAGKVIKLHNIFFDTNKYNLLPTSIIELDLLVNFLNDNPKLEIEIQGHTDNVGTDKDNLSLSINRAKSVNTYLLSKGISNNRLKFIGFGESKPIATNETAEGRQLNRRTELVITKF